MTQTGVRSGILLFVVGLWVVLRTTNQDQSGRTLIDHILGKKPNWSGATPILGAAGAQVSSTGQAAGQAIQNVGAQPAAAAGSSSASNAQTVSANINSIAQQIRITAAGITAGAVSR